MNIEVRVAVEVVVTIFFIANHCFAMLRDIFRADLNSSFLRLLHFNNSQIRELEIISFLFFSH